MGVRESVEKGAVRKLGGWAERGGRWGLEICVGWVSRVIRDRRGETHATRDISNDLCFLCLTVVAFGAVAITASSSACAWASRACRRPNRSHSSFARSRSSSSALRSTSLTTLSSSSRRRHTPSSPNPSPRGHSSTPPSTQTHRTFPDAERSNATSAQTSTKKVALSSACMFPGASRGGDDVARRWRRFW